ncbi:oxidoreductase [Streptomyces violarus]|uniref:Phytoene dehydrogenase-like protein n=1 Tax=Streptomyces violarus TaxID=67380 RepID=A0A7W4ZUX6_9ACTN|nr:MULTISPECIES: NAD(P)/FAD-dependent oxidoreductase [Streptomyces]MBB3079178.1 phytoene dehydrogenase-like protein [Streptomyces violarus]WRU01728.1 NAD(P)/FAD-dependent oxidoreductase [Streptomyces sp. CGMCC 4.1772]GHD21162.1 oxidoreductase [Streptomyces violarus]
MLEPAYQADVVVVGAGVAGLSAANRLTRAGVTTMVLEAAHGVGGRMATEKVDGFRLDRIGQLLSTAHPELRLTPGLGGLVLRPFAPGVLLHGDGRHHRAGVQAGAGGARGALHAVRALASAPRSPVAPRPPRRPVAVPGRQVSVPRSRSGAPLGTAVDQARLGAALTRLASTPAERLLARPERPAGEALAARGLPARTIDGFLRPLLAALLCDPDLTTSSRCADLALRAFASGRLCVPEGGAEALPELLARTLPPGTVHTGVRVTSVSTTSVTTAEHGEIRCRAVLVATDARAAAELLPGLRVPEFHPVTVVHHTTDEPPETGASLLLDADLGGPVAHTAVVSRVDPSRAPAGRALVSSTVLGRPPGDGDTAVRMHLARLYGMPTARWETLAVHQTVEAVPAMRPPHDLRRPVRLIAGLYVCGDHRDTSTVQGALHSGHRASAAILTDLGAGRSMHVADPLPTVPRAA